ncbi:hypothetical protein CHS0354_039590 [Potamilus streckersoni]|uniref:Uncharacterized protein n=1 Tax=Potamilus streckersoni TaxID=2493646 RepID=A0AAE0VIF1_9BIVA|nr:hypothetical protein CHS0354_039590 [Potamilus streckersoni]
MQQVQAMTDIMTATLLCQPMSSTATVQQSEVFPAADELPTKTNREITTFGPHVISYSLLSHRKRSDNCNSREIICLLLSKQGVGREDNCENEPHAFLMLRRTCEPLGLLWRGQQHTWTDRDTAW